VFLRIKYDPFSFAYVLTIAFVNLSNHAFGDCSVVDLTSTRNENISLYINGCKPHPMIRFYGVELGLKPILRGEEIKVVKIT